MDQVTIISFLLLVTLTAKVHSNLMPEIDTPPVIRIREDKAPGEFAFQIIATDPDGDMLAYGLSVGGDSNLFNVDRNTGAVTVRSALDREAKEVLSFDVTVSDTFYDVSSNVRIILEDANDNFPIFQGLPYTPKIPENTATGSSIIQVAASDADSGTAGAVSFSLTGCSPPDGNGLFEIQRTTGIIHLKGELSFTDKSSFYQLSVTAKDGGGPLGDIPQHFQESSTFVFITVEDVPNLDPQFLNLPSAATVAEGTLVGTEVYTVRARDPDTGVSSPIQYSIKSSSVAGLFQIDPTSGVVTVQSHLDREQYLESDGDVTLEIEAKETQLDVNGVNAVAIDDLLITITDVNDELPKFYSCTPDCVIQTQFTGNIDENSAVGLPVLGIDMTVRDNDMGDNSKFSLSIDGQGKEAFTISPSVAISSAKVQILMKNSAYVDFEKTQSITLTVTAVDPMKEEFQSTATVIIKINDLNDNSPEFEQETYKLEVNEHSSAGTTIATITATDGDQDDNGNLVYQLLPESITAYFTVNPATGQIAVRDGDNLDREGQSFYTATLQAKDQANNTGTANLEITLIDINDNAPQIRETYIAFVKEGPGVDFEMKIRATDFDQPGTDNNKIDYQIVPDELSDHFKLDKDTGALTLNGPLDREALDPSLNGVIKLNVTAIDRGTPPLGTSVEVEINVEDINDNKPVFNPKEYEFSVKESDQGAFIDSVFAEDLDQTVQNNRISFRIIGGGAGTFSVRSFLTPDNTGYWGNISVDQDSMLDFETRESYDFEVEALDPEQKTDKATVRVKVVDVNDETPSLSTGIEFSVNENTTIEGGKVGMIVGKDVDTKHELEYELLSTECPCNETGVCQEEWFLVEPTGQVLLNPEYTVDYEMCNKVLLHVRVTDVLTEVGKNSSEGIITITIQDINDNAPEFIQLQPNFVVVAENTDKDTSVASVSATDRDTNEENTAMTFAVHEVHFINSDNHSEALGGDIFKTVAQTQTSSSHSATIQSVQKLSPDRKGKYVVTVQVNNNNGLSSTSDVVIFTVDQSFRVTLVFSTSVSDFDANEEDIKWALESATHTTVHFVGRQGRSREQRAIETEVYAYFIYPNGTALTHNTVLNMVNGNPNQEYTNTLRDLGLLGVNGDTSIDQGGASTEMYILLAIVGGLAIMLIVMTTLLVFMRRNYTRKLKASKAMNSATMAITDNQRAGPVVPGTNKYTREGANPVLNLNIDTTTDLGFDEEDSNDDRASLNSLDYNIDMNMSEKDTMPMMVIEEEEEENGYDNNSYYEPLGAALAQRGRKKGSDSPTLSFSDPTPSTTDL